MRGCMMLAAGQTFLILDLMYGGKVVYVVRHQGQLTQLLSRTTMNRAMFDGRLFNPDGRLYESQ